jgi:hypothetical protein
MAWLCHGFMLRATHGIRWHRFVYCILYYPCWDRCVLDLRINLKKAASYLRSPIMATIFPRSEEATLTGRISGRTERLHVCRRLLLTAFPRCCSIAIYIELENDFARSRQPERHAASCVLFVGSPGAGLKKAAPVV